MVDVICNKILATFIMKHIAKSNSDEYYGLYTPVRNAIREMRNEEESRSFVIGAFSVVMERCCSYVNSLNQYPFCSEWTT